MAHSGGDRKGRVYGVTVAPALAVAVCILGYTLTTIQQTLPGAMPAMFLRGSIVLSLSQIGVLVGILPFGVMLAGPIAGRWADQAGWKLPMIVSAALIFVGTALTAIAASYGTLLFARLLCGFGVGGLTPLLYAYLVDVLPQKWRGPSSLGMAATGGISGSAALFIIRQTTADGPEGWRIAMWGFAGLAVACVIAFWLYLEVGKPASEADGAVSPGAANATAGAASLDQGNGTVFGRPLLVLSITAACVAIMNGGFFIAMVPIMLARGFSEQSALAITGISVACSSLSLAIGALLSNRVPRYVLLSWASIIGFASLAVFAFFIDPLGATIGGAGAVFGAGLCFGAITFYAAEAFPEHVRGRATGIVSGVIGLFTMVVPIVTTSLLEHTGEAGPLILVAASMLLVPALLLPFGPRPPRALPQAAG